MGLFFCAVSFPAWVWWSVHQDGVAASGRGGFVCGMPAFAAIILSFFMLVFIAGLTTAFACMDYRDQLKPRVMARKLEAVFLSLPLLSGIGMIAYTFFWFWWHAGR